MTTQDSATKSSSLLCGHGNPRSLPCYDCMRDFNRAQPVRHFGLADLPPHDVIEAERKVSDWFKARNIHSWELGGSRNR